ncbi:hypothetical protein C9374_014526 [Naegleria lovaniensis]|uniref:CYTH domain-containing protein n=1 Tax=Naegleria lovaniensis TaxID=51637 RepID=A0AA88KPY7_NAELO|nr:uncharacterized protein C9374_014526 [Naegleria lovaniensis]KAG2389126.1 hypothetical protein C9374_014526 [Naegleria lovaniensis]
MIEIEKKFHFSRNWLTDEEKVHHPLSELLEKSQFLKKQTFVDVYYDTAEYSLTCLDIWLRKRETQFECKVPASFMKEYEYYYSNNISSLELIEKEQKKLLNAEQTGNGRQLVDQYKELTNYEDIGKFLNYILFNQESSPELNDMMKKLTPFVSLQTTRTSYLYGDEFKIDLDECSCLFPKQILNVCDVGEIELMVSSENEIEIASHKILKFFTQFKLDTSLVKSKLFTALEKTNVKHMEILQKAGVLFKRMVKC